MKEFKFTAEDFSWLPGSRADEPIPLSKLAQLGCAHIANARVAPLLEENTRLRTALLEIVELWNNGIEQHVIYEIARQALAAQLGNSEEKKK